jgi:hypothetical protein
MVVASVVVSVLLAALVGYAAARKLTHRPEVVESYRRAGVREAWLNGLAVLLLAAAAGLVVGVWWPIIGIAAAASTVSTMGVAMLAVSFARRWNPTAIVKYPTSPAAAAIPMIGHHGSI